MLDPEEDDNNNDDDDSPHNIGLEHCANRSYCIQVSLTGTIYLELAEFLLPRVLIITIIIIPHFCAREYQCSSNFSIWSVFVVDSSIADRVTEG